MTLVAKISNGFLTLLGLTNLSTREIALVMEV
ncbi:unnamed protein product [Rodentolepis nana]|uniref:HTH luxR-type domain-containing protein n=1 Tax=Rodentolepis nana TaxID=102285 RepID=A0A0R3TI80_RODNA|nr:unnamed protein product [Rodentolepis nana]